MVTVVPPIVDAWLQTQNRSRESLQAIVLAIARLALFPLLPVHRGAAILVTPFLLFSKGRKHYLTLTFNDGADLVGAVEFKLHKSNYRGALRTAEEVTGLTMRYDQEGVKDTKQTVARRGDNAPRDYQGSLKISSDPEGAEIEIDGAFVGTTPRTRSVQPGEHKVRLKQKGYSDWERKVAVEAGETLEIDVELESK